MLLDTGRLWTVDAAIHGSVSTLARYGVTMHTPSTSILCQGTIIAVDTFPWLCIFSYILNTELTLKPIAGPQ